MSVEAITWALAQPIEHSSAKFVLVVLANCASADTKLAFPSTQYLADATGQDRKTVLANLGRLREWGVIEDTGKRTGATKQVVVYRLHMQSDLFENKPKNGTVPKTEASQKRNSSGFDGEQSRFSAKQSQKRDTEPSEPSGNKDEKKRARNDELPSSVPVEVWDRWCAFRGGLKGDWPDEARAISLRTLGELVAQGHDASRVVDQSIECGWPGLYAPQNPAPGKSVDSAPAPSRQSPSTAVKETPQTRCAAAVAYAAQMLGYGRIDQAEHDRLVADARDRLARDGPAATQGGE